MTRDEFITACDQAWLTVDQIAAVVAAADEYAAHLVELHARPPGEPQRRAS